MSIQSFPFFAVVLLACIGVTGLHPAGKSTVQAAPYVSALNALPDNAAGVVHCPDLPALRQAWQKTTLKALSDDNAMQPLIEASFGTKGAIWSKFVDKTGVSGKDLIEIGSGEVVIAWLPFENDRRQPSATCLVADIRGREAAARAVVDRIDQHLQSQGATRRDVTDAGIPIRIYQPKTRPGQLKIEQVVIAIDAERIIAADRDSVVVELLRSIRNGGRNDSLARNQLYQTVTARVAERTKMDAVGTDVHWFVRPFPMGRIFRDVAKVDRGNKVKILNLLENQGFDAVQAMAGTVIVGQGEFDLMHRGFIFAPPVPGQSEQFRLGARMLQFPNEPLSPLPDWVPKTIASVTQLNWKIENAFWAVETLVDEAFNDRIFRPTISGIRDDVEGPQIDLEKNVLPHLGDHLLLLTDNTQPISIDSERLLVAIELKNEALIASAVRKAMEVEPDVQKVESVPGVDIWKVQRNSGSSAAEQDFFDDFDFPETDEDDQKPLLDTWAIATLPASKGSKVPYLVFASHVDLLVDVAKRIRSGAGDGLNASPEIQSLLKTTQQAGADQVSIRRIVRLRESLRTKYELQRRGELKENDSVLASLIRRIFKPTDEKEIERPNSAKWPPYSEVESFFRNAASFVETTDDGWNLNGFLLR